MDLSEVWPQAYTEQFPSDVCSRIDVQSRAKKLKRPTGYFKEFHFYRLLRTRSEPSLRFSAFLCFLQTLKNSTCSRHFSKRRRATWVKQELLAVETFHIPSKHFNAQLA